MDHVELSIRGNTSIPKLIAAATAVREGTGYEKLLIPKRGGGSRLVLKAIPTVDKQQTAIKSVLNDLYRPPSHVHGYVPHRDNFTNAEPHLAQPVVLRVDLKSFFPSINRDLIGRILTQHGLSESAREIVLTLACVDGRLATGFATSPVLSNMAFADTDKALVAMADEAGLAFTRYADDMTFSGSALADNSFASIAEILHSFGWTINEKKTRFMRVGGPQFVTGLYVGLPDRPRVPRRMKRALRQQLHYLSKYGYLDCHRQVPWTMGHRKASGWLNYVSRVEPELARQLEPVMANIDFHLRMRIGFDDEWDVWLQELGVPEDL